MAITITRPYRPTPQTPSLHYTGGAIVSMRTLRPGALSSPVSAADYAIGVVADAADIRLGTRWDVGPYTDNIVGNDYHTGLIASEASATAQNVDGPGYTDALTGSDFAGFALTTDASVTLNPT